MGKKSKATTSTTVYGNTTTTNPYVTSQTTNSGTVSAFNKDTAFDIINNYVNSNIGNLIEEYLNPTLNSVTNRAKMNAYLDTLNSATSQAFENNIINPLSKRNMIRSSQATNLINNLAKNNSNQISQYAQELLANSQQDTAAVLANLMLWYLNGYNVLSDTQSQSLATSQGNATRTQGGGNNNSISYYDVFNYALQNATQSLLGTSLSL